MNFNAFTYINTTTGYKLVENVLRNNFNTAVNLIATKTAGTPLMTVELAMTKGITMRNVSETSGSAGEFMQ